MGRVLAIAMLCAGTFTPAVLAQNQHEHLLGFPSFVDIEAAYTRFLEEDRVTRCLRTNLVRGERIEPRSMAELGLAGWITEDYAGTSAEIGSFYYFHEAVGPVVLQDLLRHHRILGPTEELPYLRRPFDRALVGRIDAFLTARYRRKTWRELEHEALSIPLSHRLPPSLLDLPLSYFLAHGAPTIRQLFGAQPTEALRAGFVPAPKDDKELTGRLGALTLRELWERLHEADSRFASARDLARALFEFTPLTTPGKDTYRVLEGVRRDFFRRMRTELGPYRFADLWSRTVAEAIANPDRSFSRFMAISVPHEFFDARIFEATVRGLEGGANFFYSLPRQKLLEISDEEFEEKRRLLEEFQRLAWSSGVDITGSLHERPGPEESPELLRADAQERRRRAAQAMTRAALLRRSGDEAGAADAERESSSLRTEASQLEVSARRAEKELAIYEPRLERLVGLTEQYGGEVRLHMYEAARTGPFYRAVYRMLDSLAARGGERGPLTFRIGHISALEPEDVERFRRWSEASRLKDAFVFELNTSSNEMLGNSDLARLVRNLLLLQKAGLPVVMGTDEAGILGLESELVPSLSRLWYAGLPKTAIERLLLDNGRLMIKPRPLPGGQPRPATALDHYETCAYQLVRYGIDLAPPPPYLR